MKRLQFKIIISAPVGRVYSTMLESPGYEQWTKAFNPTSGKLGNWEPGSIMQFVGIDENGKKGGMISKVQENTPNQKVILCHVGMISGGKEIWEGPMIDSWKGAMEIYSFTGNDLKTELIVELDTDPDFESYFSETYPLALQKLKDICESSMN